MALGAPGGPMGAFGQVRRSMAHLPKTFHGPPWGPIGHPLGNVEESGGTPGASPMFFEGSSKVPRFLEGFWRLTKVSRWVGLNMCSGKTIKKSTTARWGCKIQ